MVKLIIVVLLMNGQSLQTTQLYDSMAECEAAKPLYKQSARANNMKIMALVCKEK